MLLNMLCLTALPATMVFAEKAQTTTNAQVNSSTSVAGSIQKPDLNLKSAVLIEPTTGQVLLSMNADEPLPPASMTKMMTEYIVAEQVKQGKLKWTDKVTVGENAAKTIGSRIFLAQGDVHTVKELYIAMAVGSANDATVALAERVAGSEQEFVKLMNETAKQMGMKTAYFINATGLDKKDMPAKFQPDTDKEDVMSAMDAAILGLHIVKDHPDYAQFTAIQSYKFRERDKAPIVNYNWMLEANKNIPNFKAYAYPGLDGLKTGHTQNAGNCFTGTAVRNGMRLISVVMGADSEAHRFTETKKVLDFGFDNFEVKQVVPGKSKVQGLDSVPVKKGVETSVGVVTDGDVSFIVPKGSDVKGVQFKTQLEPADKLVAPIEKGTKVGTITYTYKAAGMDKAQTKTVNLVTSEEVEKGSWIRLFFRAIGEMFSDLFDGIKNLF
ncbi:D-alanyl-D-alanine carboxypeptidase family protein [Paenibacillus sp. VCA1]|uniref:D-alanyl-D-alanine carboxypeptidase family protein n=1 Tax=Paenibacillus sp. VCA1 TaxID=3039148 RepID=UPI0028718BD4|nr:D-alanyl-D-alanine carboxypeptidase family protein [Paenibacillus sp. VCA1]MDR9857664.1 D-alanyl-D-alanine carboxypeptidase family protein [Paenibacillus sp. VCA1]